MKLTYHEAFTYLLPLICKKYDITLEQFKAKLLSLTNTNDDLLVSAIIDDTDKRAYEAYLNNEHPECYANEE